MTKSDMRVNLKAQPPTIERRTDGTDPKLVSVVAGAKERCKHTATTQEGKKKPQVYAVPTAVPERADIEYILKSCKQLNKMMSTHATAFIFFAIYLSVSGRKNEASPFSDKFIADIIDLSNPGKNVGGLPRFASRPAAPSPPDVSSVRSNAQVTSETSPSDIPEHMLDFHRRVLEHIRASSDDRGSSSHHSPEYMLNLYEQKSSVDNERDAMGKQNIALKRSDVVRSFEAIESYKSNDKWVLVFDTAAILSHERIRLAELRLVMPRDYNDLTSIEIWDERKVSSSVASTLERQKIGSFNIEEKRTLNNQKIATDVTRLIRRWYNANQRNKESQDVPEEQPQFLETIRFKRSSSSLAPASSMQNTLFIYSTNKDIELIDVATARQNRNRRSSKRGQVTRRTSPRHREMKRRNRQSSKKNNKTDRRSRVNDEIRYNDFEVDRRSQQQSIELSNDFEIEQPIQVANIATNIDETEEWRQAQSDVTVISDSKNAKEVLQSSVASSFGDAFVKTPSKPTHCRRVDFEIDFEKIGWGDWIVYPKRYNAYRCEGECRAPLSNTGKTTNHAYMQSLLATHYPGEVSQPCCVPTKLKPLSILYYEDGVVKQREHEEMVVAECGCR